MTEGRPGEEKESTHFKSISSRCNESLSIHSLSPCRPICADQSLLSRRRSRDFNHRIPDTTRRYSFFLTPFAAPAAAGCQLDLHLFLLFYHDSPPTHSPSSDEWFMLCSCRESNGRERKKKVEDKNRLLHNSNNNSYPETAVTADPNRSLLLCAPKQSLFPFLIVYDVNYCTQRSTDFHDYLFFVRFTCNRAVCVLKVTDCVFALSRQWVRK